MEAANNKSLQEIKEPGTRAKLEGIQEVSFDIDAEIASTRKDVDTKKMMVTAINQVANRVFGEAQAIQSAVDKGTMAPEEAKIRMEQTQRITTNIKSFEAECRAEALKAQGKLMGLEQLTLKIGKRFDDTVLKYERHQRMEAEDAEQEAPKPPPVTMFQGKVKLGKGKGKGRK